MDLLALLGLLQGSYLDDLNTARLREMPAYEQLAPEVTVEGPDGAYRGLHTVDLAARNGQETRAIEVPASDAAHAGETTAIHGPLTLAFDRVSWDAVSFTLDPAPAELGGFDDWFTRWMDIDGLHHAQGPDFGGVIHSASLGGDTVTVDFGSAPPQAFTELLDIFADSGVRQIRLGPARR